MQNTSTDYRQFIEKQLQQAAELAQKMFKKDRGVAKTDDPNQVLTEADVAIGELLVSAVKNAFPEHNIIDEEAGVVDNGSRYTWVIDPIDGTSNFAVGTPDWGILIGLLDEDVPVAGGVAVPIHGELYLAQKGRGATKNGTPIRVSEETELLQTLVAVGIDSNQQDPGATRAEASVFGNLVLAVRNLRSSGCEAIDPMRVVDGRYGGRMNFSSKIWDNVAVQIIVEEAGGLHTAHNGDPLDYSSPLTKLEKNYSTLTASPKLHKQLLKVLKS